MDSVVFGDTGVEVSEICLGCMSFGDGSGWKIDEKKSKELIDYALDLGINFFDTANVYSSGKSEKILGEAIQEYNRDRLFIATKVYSQMDPDNPNSGGLSRKTIHQEIENSLERLKLDTVDLYQIHRWDYNTDIKETLRGLNNIVENNKALYIGASSMWAYQFSEALHKSQNLDVDGFKSMQNHYNLLYREEEREMLPLCKKKNIAIIPWSPLARGYLTRPHNEIENTQRGKKDEYAERYPYLENGGKEINERVEELAKQKDVSMAQIALSWILHKEWVDSPIIGATKKEHIKEAIQATEISLTKKEIEYLEKPYKPKPVIGHD